MNVQEGDSRDSHFSRKRSLEDLLRPGDDDSGYIEGKVFMIWPPRNRVHRISLEVAQDSALYRFEVEIPHKDGIIFRPHERVFLALKGMKVDQRKESSAPHYFPIVLRFPNGVVFKYLSGANAGRVVNTREGNTDEWYNPGTIHTVLDAVIIDASTIRNGPAPAKAGTLAPTLPREDLTSRRDEGDRSLSSVIAVSDGLTTAQPMVQQPSAERPSRFSKSRSRKKRKLNRGKEAIAPHGQASNAPGPGPADAASLCHEQPQASIHGTSINVADSHSTRRRVNGHTNREGAVREDGEIDPSRENHEGGAVAVPQEANALALRLKAGVRTQRGDLFTALSDLQIGHSLINVIGVVISVNPEKRTRTNEWSRSFTLIDPSTIDSPRQYITVNCFQKRYPEWLPQVQKDDIVILRKLKIVEFSRVVSATGYNDKLRWAVYDPVTHSTRPPNKGSAPEKELIEDGMGYEFSPYWEPIQDSTELEYCQRIGEWWKAKQELDGQCVPIVQCSAARRQHLLISEASPDLPPKGFFDCTVEVLQKFDNDGRATVVFVTDYTASTLVRRVQAAWCPPELCDRVLQCDMWDEAKNIAKMMNPGEYWYLHNIRAKWNSSHYMEGTMQLAEKVAQLDESKLEEWPHLRALLSRKCELGLNKSSLPLGPSPSHIFPEMLLQDVEGSTTFFTCVVELVHNDLDSQDGHFIYTTDYTYNPDLPTTVSTAGWAHNLQHRVLKIKLDDAQARISSDLSLGSILLIHNLRIRRSSTSGSMHGCLGGENKLIYYLHDSSSDHVQTLQRNKEKWERENMLDGLTILPSRSDEEARGPLRQPSPLLDTTFQQVLARPVPDTFRVLARTVDFFPFSLEDASVLRCTKCELSPLPSFKHCPRCDDMLETHCKWFYCLYIFLQDEQGSELIVSLSGKECTLLQNVDPVDFRYDQDAYDKFLAKLDPVLGNLRDVHLAWSRNEHKVIESPPMVFTIESWTVGDETAYGLLNCIPA